MKKFPFVAAAGALALSLSLTASAEDTAPPAGTPTSTAPHMMKQDKKPNVTVNGGCMAAAVTRRDPAIAAALQLVVTAIQKRGTDESAAWTNNDKNALKAAHQAFEGTWKTFDQSRKAAWTQFATDAKACKTTAGMTNADAPTGPSGL
ncbi:hypothetical protein HY213_04780 [Candidatus Peregrinibacteria bacterium]|nr:hypothetical protein [Candidatus Peregrinibacteria bacterium]